MSIDLNPAEIEALVTVVSTAISDLSPDIVAADNWEHRDRLRERRANLQSALFKLERSAAVQP